MAGAAKRRRQADNAAQRGNRGAGQASSSQSTPQAASGPTEPTSPKEETIDVKDEPTSPTASSSTSRFPMFFDGPHPSNFGKAAGKLDQSRGRQTESVAGESARGSRPGSGTRPMQPEYKVNKNIDIGSNVYNLFTKYDIPHQSMPRPAGGNTTGTPVIVAINSFPILQYPNKTVYQYDVLIGSGVEKRGLIMAIWESKVLEKTLGQGWVFDGNRLAWSLRKMPETRITIDMDEEKGIKPREGRNNRHKVQIRPTTEVNLAAIHAWLNGKIQFDTAVLQSIDFLDHLMRVTPSKEMIAIKRSFFHQRMVVKEEMGHGIEAMKGVYQSIRAVHGGKLVVNVDVSNCCFWMPASMAVVAQQHLGLSALDIGNRVKKEKKTWEAPPTETVHMIRLKKMKKLRFNVEYLGASEATKKKTFIVKDFLYMNCHEYKFDWKDRKTGEVRANTSVTEYYELNYNVHLNYPTLPVVETMKRGVVFPMEFCHIQSGQRYPYKLDELMTTRMIKFAVTKPQERKEGIMGGLKLLKWDQDPFLKNYGLKISPQMIETQARLLTPPVVQFGGKGTQKPGTSGRWRLDGMQFYEPNKKDLVSWGVCVMNHLGRDQVNQTQAERFMAQFITTYQGHGGRISNKKPPFIAGIPDTGKCVENVFNVIGNKCGGRPQLMIFMLSGRDAFNYSRIKKSADCRWGVMSQCMQNAHVMRCQGQYISNVLMKVNAKLGGATARVASKNPAGHFKIPTIIIGADVSHASPGSLQPSMAAVTVSMDKVGMRYAAAVDTNGHRVEMITTFNMEELLTPLFREWQATVGQGRMPLHVMYFRDGVSEGQFQHVLQQEIRDLKRIWDALDGTPGKPNSAKIKYTVVIASKRHHIRFFPKERTPAADKNANPCPGVLVEKDITHPFEWDFYLNSHSAIQGTARPTHYHVLMDEAGMSPNDLQNMIYEHCYQYMRSTTPVSLFPAVYYAHLASNRAKSHEDIAASSGPHKGDEQKQKEALMKLRDIANLEGKKLSKTNEERLRRLMATETPPLIKMDNSNQIMWNPWYI